MKLVRLRMRNLTPKYEPNRHERFLRLPNNALRRCTSSSSKAWPVSVRLMGPKMLQWDSSSDSILNQPINKKSILSKYNEDCHKLGYSGQLTSTKKLSQHIYLHIYQLLYLQQINLHTHKNVCCQTQNASGDIKTIKILCSRAMTTNSLCARTWLAYALAHDVYYVYHW